MNTSEQTRETKPVSQAQIVAINRQFPWLRNYVPIGKPIRIQRADLELCRRHMKVDTMVVDFLSVFPDPEDHEHIYLIDSEGGKVATVGVQEHPSKPRHWLWNRNPTPYETFNPCETVQSTLYRIGPDLADRVHFVLVCPPFYQHPQARRECVLCKPSQKLNLREWLEKEVEAAQADLRRQLEELEQRA